MNLRKKLCCLLAAVLLTATLALPTQAASYPDLPTTHWAYEAMDRAAGLGIISGVGGGAMAPSATLTWAQYLTMLARTFAAEDYLEALNSGTSWDLAGYRIAKENGILLKNEFLPVSEDNLNTSVSRQDVAVLLSRVLPDGVENYYHTWESVPSVQSALSDFTLMDKRHQDAVEQLYSLGVTRGKTDGTFGMNDIIQRADGAFMLMKVLDLADKAYYRDEKDIILHFKDLNGTVLLPDQEVSSFVGQSLYTLAAQYGDQIGYYTYQQDNIDAVSSACGEYTLTFQPMSAIEIQKAEFWDKLARGEVTYEDYWKQDFLLKMQDDNPRKHMLLFGNEYQSRFSSQAEAEASMVSVTVPVWRLSNGKKISSTATFSIHAALAQDVKEIFTEIYNDPEQFPIQDLGGYSWRGDSATGEHNCGTAIDINANENYQVRDGQPMVGQLWQPGVNSYSIPEDGSVVRIFAEHGWSWGGNAWAWSTDPNSGYHDYMHFSYMGG